MDSRYKIGDHKEILTIIKSEDINQYGDITGDKNPLHFDTEMASKSIFKERIAQGFLVASTISKVLGTILPGPGTIYLSQNLRFKKPVKIGDEIRTIVTIKKITEKKNNKKILELETNCFNQNNIIVIEGKAVVMI